MSGPGWSPPAHRNSEFREASRRAERKALGVTDEPLFEVDPEVQALMDNAQEESVARTVKETMRRLGYGE